MNDTEDKTSIETLNENTTIQTFGNHKLLQKIANHVDKLIHKIEETFPLQNETNVTTLAPNQQNINNLDEFSTSETSEELEIIINRQNSSLILKEYITIAENSTTDGFPNLKKEIIRAMNESFDHLSILHLNASIPKDIKPRTIVNNATSKLKISLTDIRCVYCSVLTLITMCWILFLLWIIYAVWKFCQKNSNNGNYTDLEVEENSSNSGKGNETWSLKKIFSKESQNKKRENNKEFHNKSSVSSFPELFPREKHKTACKPTKCEKTNMDQSTNDNDFGRFIKTMYVDQALNNNQIKKQISNIQIKHNSNADMNCNPIPVSSYYSLQEKQIQETIHNEMNLFNNYYQLPSNDDDFLQYEPIMSERGEPDSHYLDISDNRSISNYDMKTIFQDQPFYLNYENAPDLQQQILTNFLETDNEFPKHEMFNTVLNYSSSARSSPKSSDTENYLSL